MDVAKSRVAEASSDEVHPSGRARGGLISTKVGLMIARLALPLILVLFVVLFSLLRPQEFFTVTNLRAIVVSQSVLGILAVGTLLPLVIGHFDLSVAANLGLGAILCTGLPSKEGVGFFLATGVALGACTLVGVTNGLLVAKVGINALISTLGMASLITGGVLWYTDGAVVYSGIPAKLTQLGQGNLWGIPNPVVVLAVVALIFWYFLEYVPIGRHLFAIGGSPEAARLSGINVPVLTVFTFALTGLLAGVAGVIQSAELGSGNPSVGPDLLLPAFCAAFLGATTVKPGIYNVPGTIIAVFTLATGVVGLELLGLPFYIDEVFSGAALIVAVVVTRYLRREAI
jgi:ribose transport system permease protein